MRLDSGVDGIGARGSRTSGGTVVPLSIGTRRVTRGVVMSDPGSGSVPVGGVSPAGGGAAAAGLVGTGGAWAGFTRPAGPAGGAGGTVPTTSPPDVTERAKHSLPGR